MLSSFLRPAGGAGFLLAGWLLGAAPAATPAAPPRPRPTAAPTAWAARADSAQAALRQRFWDAAGQYYRKNSAGDTAFNYWWQAHGLDALLDGYQRTKSPAYLAQMRQLQAGAKAHNHHTYLNPYYDDMEWEALANLRAYEVTKEASYKATAAQLWADIKLGWNEQQGGGIAWRKTQLDYKNTPANAPAAILAARFYQLGHDPADLAWAQKIYQWQKQTLVDPSTGAVWDGVNRQGNGQIDKNWRFTYCQGVFIGAGLALYQATKQATYLADATRTADYVLSDSFLAAGGLLPTEGQGDGGLFKGILVRYLALLATEPAVSAANRVRYLALLQRNGQSLTTHATSRPQYLLNNNWAALPTGPLDSSAEMSGVMLLEALASLQARRLL